MIKRFLILVLTIVSILMCICGLSACNKVEFKVNFVVDGGIYSTLNTNGEEIIKMPENPTKEGYTFDGWFWDKGTWQTPFTANSLLDAPLSSDMSVYCKWKANTINVESVTLNKTEITLHENDVEYLTTTILPTNATNTEVTWESSNPTIATVIGGKVTAIRVGNATITATTVDGGKIATCNVYVSPVLVESVSLNHTTLTLLNGESKTLTATIYPNNATEKGVVWQSSNSSIVTVENGVIKAVGYGTATITAISVDGEKTATCTISIVQDKIEFKTLTVDGETVYGKVSNDTATFSFIKEIVEYGNATYKVFKEITCETEIYSKSILLNAGDNTVYVLQSVGKDIKLYTVTVRRRPTYSVTFNVNGGSAVGNQVVEEDSLVVEPTTIKVGYTFNGWDYDFSKPITETTTVNANWTANTDTKYVVEYYHENLNNNSYTKVQTLTKTGTTDTTAKADIKNYDHFTYNSTKSISSGNINANGSLVLKIYYNRNVYKITTQSNNAKAGSITSGGNYKFDKEFVLTATTNAGYTFNGWYEGETLVCETEKFTAKSKKVVTYTAKWSANKNTKYIVKYYLENLGDSNYTLTDTDELTGTTDTTATAVIKDYENFTYNEGYSKNVLSGNINGNGSLILSVYYTRDIYTVTTQANNTNEGSITGTGKYKYGKQITLTATPNLGYNVNWYNGEILLSNDLEYNVTIDKDITITAKFTIKEEMKNFNFTSTPTTCEVTGVKNNNITSVVIPDSVTSIGEYAFSGCGSLTSVTIGNSVTSIGEDAFSYCDSLTKVNYLGTIDQWVEISFGYLSNPLLYAKNLYINDVLITKAVLTSATKISNYAFSGCDSLTSIEISDSVTSIGNTAFAGCDSLTSVTIGNGVTSIGSNAFQDCHSLTSVTIGNGVTSIGDYAFYYCYRLTSIKYRGTSSQWWAIRKGSFWNLDTGDCSITYNYKG